MSEPKDIEYRRMVSNIFRELSAEDVQQIAYVRLIGKDDITKYSAGRQNATSLDLMQTLERHGVFSKDNIDGLIEVLKDARRTDLINRIEAEKHRFASPCPVAAVKGVARRFRAGRKKGSPSDAPRPSTPTEERAGMFQEHRRSKEDCVTGSGIGRVLPKHPPPRKKEVTLPGPKYPPRTPTRAGSPNDKKKPILPPRQHHEKITQETVDHPMTQQQLVFPRQKSAHALKVSFQPPSTAPTTKPPVPPRKPPKVQSQYNVIETVTDDGSRDSGNWTGSFSETVAEWTRHHSKSLPDLSGSSQYQPLKMKEDGHLYAIPQ